MLGLPGLAERAHADLAERAVYYLKRTITYVPPGSKILELGCAPGSFARLLTQAGMKVTGVEMSGHAVEFVRQTFGIEVLHGPLEQLRLRRKFDAVVLIDLLEHLPRPLATLQACVDRLQGDGILLLQTPCYRGEGASWPMLSPPEHLFLYTVDSVRALLTEAGFEVIEVDDSLFPYDMWVVAALHSALPRRAEPLKGVAELPAVMIRLVDRQVEVAEQLAAADRDRAAKADLIARISDELQSIRVDQRDKEALIVGLTDEIEAVRADQRDKDALIVTLNDKLEAVRADQNDKEALIVALNDRLEAVRADQNDKEALIVTLNDKLEAVRADQNDKEALIVTLNDELEAVRADQDEKEALISRVSEELEAVRADQRAKEELIEELSKGKTGQ